MVRLGIKGRAIAAVILPALIAGAVCGCSSDECLDNKNSLPLAGFYSSEEPLQAVSLDSLEIAGVGVPGDSLLHEGKRTLSQTYLPFRIDQPVTRYVFRYLKKDFAALGLADTITFRYDIEPYFVSSACGAVYNYKITSIETTHVAIDSVVCPSGIITNAPVENLRVYFRTVPNVD